jgi:hypothetical protein
MSVIFANVVFFPMFFLGSAIIAIYEYLNLKSYHSFHAHITPNILSNN